MLTMKKETKYNRGPEQNRKPPTTSRRCRRPRPAAAATEGTFAVRHF
jgi:hypothetical protein